MNRPVQEIEFRDAGRVLFRGAIGVFSINGLGIVAALGLQIVLSRILGAEQYGVYIYAITWLNILALSASLGLETALLRYIPTYTVQKKWRLLRGILTRSQHLVMAAGFILSGLTVIAAWALRHRIGHELSTAFMVSGLLLPVVSLIAINQAALRSLKRVMLSQIPQMLLRPCFLALSAAVFFWGFDRPLNGVGAMAFDVGASAAALMILVAWLFRAFPDQILNIKPAYASAEWIRVSLPMLIVSVLTMVLKRADVILVGIFLGTTQAGIYAVASKLAQLLSFGLKSTNLMVGPMIPEFYASRKTEVLQRTVTQAAWMATIWCLAVGIVLTIGRQGVLGVFGKEFLPGITPFIILTIGQLVTSFTGPVSLLLNMTGYQDKNAKIVSIIAACNLLLLPPAILYGGINGAAAVTSLLFALKNLWSWWAVKQRVCVNASIFKRTNLFGGLRLT